MSKRMRRFFQSSRNKRSQQRKTRIKRRRMQLETLNSRQLLACDVLLNADADPGDVYAVCAVLTGTAESEKLQGFESNDTVTGGGGPDLFPFTTGNDVVTDFNPSEDMIDVGDFARPSDDFATLKSLADIAGASTEVTNNNGTVSLVIDVDGNLGNSTTTLVGVGLADLDASNVFFGTDSESIPPLEFTHIAEFLVMYSNNDVYLFPAHDLSNHPINGQLVTSGDCDSTPPVDEDPGNEDPGNEDPGDEDPGDEDPGDEDPGDEDPGDEDPGDEDPGDEDPGDEDPGDEDPGDEDPGNEDPGNEDPGNEDPGNEDPGDEDPGDEDPGNEDPGDEDSGDEDPDDEDLDDDNQELTTVKVSIPETTGVIKVSLEQGNVVLRVAGQLLSETPINSADSLTIVGSEGDDRLRLNLRGPDAIQLTAVTVLGGGGNDDVALLNSVDAAFAGAIALYGNDGNDKLRATPVGISVLLDGGDGDDRLFGGQADDYLIGGAGDDRLFGLGGDDVLEGGDGDDRLFGLSGNDILDGGDGDDRLLAGDGDDWLSGGLGNDLLHGGTGNDALFETIATDVVLTNRKMTGLGTDRIRKIKSAEFSVIDDAKVDGTEFKGGISIEPVTSEIDTDE
ncbi:MAG: Ca2+-binding RTX toxin-like protein [Pirellulaceae bacterium]|jgi:Ca2+-binding RTX toxin-like protein